MRKRNNAIDILKFVFSLLILFYHAVYVVQADHANIPRGGVYWRRVFFHRIRFFDGAFCF